MEQHNHSDSHGAPAGAAQPGGHGARDHATMDHATADKATVDQAAMRHAPGGHAGDGHGDHGDGHGGHGDEHDAHGGAHISHAGHEQLFRRRFWVSLVLSVPVLLYSEMLQDLLGFTMPAFPGSAWIGPVFALIVFAYGGIPFLKMAVPELRQRQPGMMTLISLAITVALVYSVAALFIPDQMGFFWELVTLIDIMLLGHWLETRSEIGRAHV